MVLYCKAGPDGKSLGDCPFAHYVRLVLEEKGLEYELKPCTQETKPKWLLEFYDGKMPALQHRKECYVESSVIAEYLEFFFPSPSLQPNKVAALPAETALDGFFPAVAKYLKHVQLDSTNVELRNALQSALAKLERYLAAAQSTWLCGGSISLLDCSLIPKLYHLEVGVEGYKDGIPSLQDYPHVAAYYQRAQKLPSFQATLYPKETVLWGWSNARN